MQITPVKGTADYLPNEVLIRDYLQNSILETYRSCGFERISTPIIEDIENLDKSDGGENLNLIFKIMKRGEKLDQAVYCPCIFSRGSFAQAVSSPCILFPQKSRLRLLPRLLFPREKEFFSGI